MQEVALASDLNTKLDMMRDAIAKVSETTSKNMHSIVADLHAARARRDERVKAANAEIALAEREYEDALGDAIVVIETVR